MGWLRLEATVGIIYSNLLGQGCLSTGLACLIQPGLETPQGGGICSCFSYVYLYNVDVYSLYMYLLHDTQFCLGLSLVFEASVITRGTLFKLSRSISKLGIFWKVMFILFVLMKQNPLSILLFHTGILLLDFSLCIFAWECPCTGATYAGSPSSCRQMLCSITDLENQLWFMGRVFWVCAYFRKAYWCNSVWWLNSSLWKDSLLGQAPVTPNAGTERAVSGSEPMSLSEVQLLKQKLGMSFVMPFEQDTYIVAVSKKPLRRPEELLTGCGIL